MPRNPDRRGLALALTLVAALFTGTVIGVMATTLFAENDPLPDSARMQALQTQLEKGGDADATKAVIRALDVQLRKDYFARRSRLTVGAWLLLAGAAATVFCARWLSALDASMPTPITPQERADEEGWRLGRTRAAWSLGAAAVALAGMGLWMAWQGAPPLPAPAASLPAGRTLVRHESRQFKENWPRFRGPSGMGIAPQGDWLRQWDVATGEGILWKTAIPSPGNSSPIIWGDRIFLTGGAADSREVMCFERQSGRLLWSRFVDSARKPAAGEEELHVLEQTGYAAPTPATDGARVFAFFATADLAALDFEGNVLWVKNLGKPENAYGIATSPVLWKDTVIVQFDRGLNVEDKLSMLLALDAATGAERWRTARPVANSWSVPIVVEANGRSELLTAAEPWVISYDPDTGRELWRVEGIGRDHAASPIVAEGMVFVTGENANAMAIRIGGRGDVTRSHIAWTADQGMSDASSPVCDGKIFLQANSGGTVTALAADTGKRLWQQRFDDMAFWSSPTLAGDTVYLFEEHGKALVLRWGESFEKIAQMDMGEAVSATPAFADSRIYVRGQNHLFCIGKAAP